MTTGRSVAGIFFDYNGDGETAGSATPGNGAALFLDGAGSSGNLSSGYGDIKIAGEDMLKLLKLLDSESNPILYIPSPGSSYQRPLVVAISPDYSPMEFEDNSKTGQDRFVGFDIFLAEYIAAQLGRELILMPMSFDACQAAVDDWIVEMSISSYTYTADRAAAFNVSDPYSAGGSEGDGGIENNVILMRKGDDELTAQVNEILAKAYAEGLHDTWYEEAVRLAAMETAAEVGYDDYGNVMD